MRLIDADALVAKMKALDIWHETEYQDGYFDGFSDGIAEVEEAPTIEAEPVKRGRWEETVISYHDTHTDEYWDDFYYEHKACGYQGDFKFNYCPNCGAKMDLEG